MDRIGDEVILEVVLVHEVLEDVEGRDLALALEISTLAVEALLDTVNHLFVPQKEVRAGVDLDPRRGPPLVLHNKRLRVIIYIYSELLTATIYCNISFFLHNAVLAFSICVVINAFILLESYEW